MKNKKKILLYLPIAFVVFVICYFFSKSYNTLVINHNIRVASRDNYLFLTQITPFDWDQAFIIEDPYIGGEELDRLIGIDCNLKRSDFDSTRRIVFAKDKKFVYDYMYKWSKIEFLPLGITIDRDNCKFTVEKAGTNKLILKLAAK